MAMKPIEATVKNKFFTYFSVDGSTVKYREKNEIWNFDGVAMKIQGDMKGSPGGDFNSFGKKHLLSTEGGKVQTPLEKATKLLNKRGAGKAATSSKRNDKLGAIRKEMGGDKKKNMQEASGHFEPSAYGKQKTETNTVILLDNFATKDDVMKPFKDAIAAKTDWGTTPNQEVDVALAADSVMTLETSGAQTFNSNVKVTIWYNDNTYHIYHLDGAF